MVQVEIKTRNGCIIGLSCEKVKNQWFYFFVDILALGALAIKLFTSWNNYD